MQRMIEFFAVIGVVATITTLIGLLSILWDFAFNKSEDMNNAPD